MSLNNPHQIQNTISTEEAEGVLNRLCVVKMELAKLCYNTANRIVKFQEELLDNAKKLEDMLSRLYVPYTKLVVKEVDYTMMVCGATDCTDVYQVDGSTKVHYKTICHKRCTSKCVRKESRGNPKPKWCNAMATKHHMTTCTKCGHSYREHLSINYTTKPCTKFRTDKKVHVEIRGNNIDKFVIEKGLDEYLVKLKRYRTEFHIVRKAKAEFRRLIRERPIPSCANSYKIYVEYLIARNKKLYPPLRKFLQ